MHLPNASRHYGARAIVTERSLVRPGMATGLCAGRWLRRARYPANLIEKQDLPVSYRSAFITRLLTRRRMRGGTLRHPRVQIFPCPELQDFSTPNPATADRDA